MGSCPLLESAYITDEDGEPRIAWSVGEDAKVQIVFRDGDRGWRWLTSLPGFTEDSRPWGYVARDRALQVVEPISGGFGIFAVSVDTGERKLLARTELVPPTEALQDDESHRILAVESLPDGPRWQFLEPEHPVVKLLDRLLHAYAPLDVKVVSVSEDDRLALVLVSGDRQPGLYALADVATGATRPVAQTLPLLYPVGLAADARAPLVVLPHGGPFGIRDVWGFEEEVQRLASEGFAVLQVNYRGSGGYGEPYQEDGYRRWGDRMIEDILDATRWVVGQGRVDGARMCTYGASFGGYAALQATILAPDLFRCAAGVSGVYDLTRLDRSDDIITSRRTRGYLRTTAGDDEAALRAASPAHHADLIKVPVLLAHGAKDSRVPLAQAERLRDALAAQGRPPDWVVEPHEGHGFYDEAARERFYARLLAFLKRHTAPAPAAASEPTAPPAPRP
jgi:dienelactone hydrolase